MRAFQPQAEATRIFFPDKEVWGRLLLPAAAAAPCVSVKSESSNLMGAGGLQALPPSPAHPPLPATTPVLLAPCRS